MAIDDAREEGDVTAEVKADELDPLIGVTLDGRFRLVSPLGKGAMGTVYRAVQLPLNRAVAIKVLDSNFGAGRDATFRQRFLVEAALTAKLQHPNTVRIIDYGVTSDGLYYLAMEYLDGQTLDRVLSKGALPWRRALSIGQQVARALREAHELGVVHRDLKPGNVMMLSADDDTEYVKVLDFGLVKSFVEGQDLEGRAVTQQGMLMGSPPYMAPEQGDENIADPRSDLYSLGVVLFEMLAGRVPFAGKQALEIILKHVHEPVPPLVAPPGFDAVPEALVAVVRKCLAKSPMDRYQSMDELLQALAEIAGSAPSLAALPPVPATAISQPIVVSAVKPTWLIVGFVAAMAVGVGVTAVAMKPKRTVEVVTVPVPTEPEEKLAPQPTKTVFHVESDPPGASVLYQGKVVGVTPLDLPVDSTAQDSTSVKLELRKEGYLPLTVSTGGSGPRIELMQKLQKLAPPPPPPDETPAPGPTEPSTGKPEKPAKTTKSVKKPGHPAKLNEEEEEPSPPSKDELKRPK